MITIEKDLIQKVNEFQKLKRHLALVVDLDQEKKLSDLHEELFEEIDSLDENFTNVDIAQITTALTDEEDEENFYLYDIDEIIEVLFPSIGKKNLYIHSAYNWIDTYDRIKWIINNVLCGNEYYDVIENINDKYVMSKKKLSNII